MNSDPRIAARRVETDPADHDNAVDLGRLIAVVWDGKWTIGLCAFVALFLCTIYIWRSTVPLYTAQAVVALDSRDESVISLDSVVSGLNADFYTIGTEVQVLQARNLVGKLVEEMNLEADPEFNWTIAEEEESLMIQVFGPLIGRVRGFLRSHLVPTDETADTGAVEELSAKDIRDLVIDAVLGSINVSNLNGTYVFQITVATEDPRKSAEIADTLARVYIRDQLEVKFEATQQATTWLTERVRDLKTELETAENAVKDFNTNSNLVSAEALELENRQIKEFRDRLADLDVKQQDLDLRVGVLETAVASGDPAVMAAAADDTTLEQMVPRLERGGAALRQSFDTRFQQVLVRARLNRDRNRSQRDTVRQTIADQEARIQRQSADLLTLQQLTREAEASGLIYEYFLGRLKETSVQSGIQQADSRILSDAVVPSAPSSPRKNMMRAVALVIGVLIGTALVLLREMRRGRHFRSARELERATGVAVLGQIPKAPVTQRRRVLRYLVTKPTSTMAEAVRNMRTSIVLSNIDQAPQVIMITSSVPGEGKTTQSLSLSHSLAGMGQRVLLIEGDIRRRVFTSYFNISRRPGLLKVVGGEAPIEEALYHDPDTGFDVLAGEKSSVNAADFFSSERFKAFIQAMRAQYDTIIIDTPPVLVVPDARVIAQSADAVVYAVHWGRTPKALVSQGIESFAAVNVTVTGTVLSQINPREAQRYGSDYAYYGYAKYYRN